MTVPIKRRSPADQIRYCVDRLNEIHAQSSSEQTALIASRHLLAVLAQQLDAMPATRQKTEDAAVRTVQGWMAMDVHLALGLPFDHAATHQGHDSWADWWAVLCAQVRTLEAFAAPPPERAYCCGNPEDHAHPEEALDA